LSVDDFGETGAERTVMIDTGVAKVFVREGGEAVGGGGWGEGSGLDGGEEFEERGLVHGVTSRLVQWVKSAVRFANADISESRYGVPGFQALL
jgi:hypothetical protein